MAVEIRPYTEKMINAVKDFNVRLKAAGAPKPNEFPQSHVPGWLPMVDDRKIYQEYFLALEGEAVRGAFILKHQEFSFKGQIKPVADYQLPISEGIINREYGLVGIQLLTNALKRHPLLFALGMGGYEQPLPKMLKAMGWSMCSVPFFFKVNHPLPFLRNITFLRKTKLRSLFMDFLAVTGLGWVAIKLLQTILRKKRLKDNSVSVEKIDQFSDWADELWNECKNEFSMIAVRDSTTLNILYPSNGKRFIRLKVSQGGQAVGWAVVLNTQMAGHKQFGKMRVGSIVDCLSLPENAFKVVWCAMKFLEKAGSDITLSNQSHSSWCSALKAAGFITAPSNFIFAASKSLAKLLHPFDLNRSLIHLNRGDGDGPIHL